MNRNPTQWRPSQSCSFLDVYVFAQNYVFTWWYVYDSAIFRYDTQRCFWLISTFCERHAVRRGITQSFSPRLLQYALFKLNDMLLFYDIPTNNFSWSLGVGDLLSNGTFVVTGFQPNCYAANSLYSFDAPSSPGILFNFILYYKTIFF